MDVLCKKTHWGELPCQKFRMQAYLINAIPHLNNWINQCQDPWSSFSHVLHISFLFYSYFENWMLWVSVGSYESCNRIRARQRIYWIKSWHLFWMQEIIWISFLIHHKTTEKCSEKIFILIIGFMLDKLFLFLCYQT